MAHSEFFKEVFDQLATDGAIGDPHGIPAYSYLRVSSSGQAEEGRSGLPRQIMNVHEIASEKGLKVPWGFVFADDHTGFEFRERPQLSKLRQEFKNSKRRASAVVMENIDRLSRNADWHQGFLLDEMKQYGLEVVFWKSFSSRIERAVLGAISQEGMEEAKKRMADGNIYKAKDGRITARTPAYGYMFVDSEGNPGEKVKKDTHYTLNPDEAEVVRLIFEKVGIEGWSVRQLAPWLEERFSPPKNYVHWEPRQIALFIKNPVYKGEFIAHRYQNLKVVKKGATPDEPVKIVEKKVERPRDEWIIVPVPPIVSPELFQMANKMLEKNAQMGRRNARIPYLLTGLVKCATCNHTYVGGRKKKKGKKGQVWTLCFYRCSGRFHRAPQVIQEIGCTQSQVSCSILETAVWSAVCKVLLEPEVLIASMEEDFAKGENAQINAEITFLEREIRGKDLEDEKLYRAYLADVFDENEFAARRRLLKESREKLEQELEDLRGRVLTRDQLEERKGLVLAMADHALESGLVMDAPFEIKQRIIKLVVDKIMLNVNEGWFRIEGVVRGKCRLNESIESTSVGRDTLNMTLFVVCGLRKREIQSVSVLW